jgi:hypothetical protein
MGTQLICQLPGNGIAIERIYTDPGNQVKASCAPSMQSWTLPTSAGSAKAAAL